MPGSQTVLNAISMVSPDEGWAVGNSSASSISGAQVLFLHDQGGIWSRVPVPISGYLTTISMVSATDGWAGGTPGFLHYDGKTWTRVQTTAGWRPYHIQMLSATDGWGTSLPHALLHYDGYSWTTLPLPAGLIPAGLPEGTVTNVRFVGLSMTSADDGWVIANLSTDVQRTETPISPGTEPTASPVPSRSAALLHYTHGQWQVYNRFEEASLVSLSMLSAEEGWAVGGSPTGTLLLHYSQGQWVTVKSSLSLADADPKILVLHSASDGWLVCHPGPDDIPALLHYNGSDWSKVSLPLTLDQGTKSFEINGLAMTSATEGWAVGIRIWSARNRRRFGFGGHIPTVTLALLPRVVRRLFCFGFGGHSPTVTPLILHDSGGTWSIVQS